MLKYSPPSSNRLPSNNRPLLVKKEIIIAPGYYSRKYSVWKDTKVYTAFLFIGLTFWEENVEDRVALLESNILNCFLKITMANLLKIGLKMRE